MSSHRPQNIVASVHQCLLNLALKRREPFQVLLTRDGLERLLYRLSQSDAASRFILKGALLFWLWDEQPHRATRDLDLLGSGDHSVARRKTPLPAETPLALTATFGSDQSKQTQWQAFLRKGRLEVEASVLGPVVAFLAGFLLPPLLALTSNQPFVLVWPAGGPWQAAEPGLPEQPPGE